MKEQQSWYILDTGSIWLKEFAVALSSMVPTRNWCPEIRNFGCMEHWERLDRVPDPQLEMTRFPLQRGYARFPIRHVLPFERAVEERMRRAAVNPDLTTLICTAPFYAPVAERWRGSVVYYLTDMTKEYPGMDAKQILGLDRRMCRVATAVCPNSTRIADYLQLEAGCDPRKITVIPNATRQGNLLPQPLITAGPLPFDIADLPRPVIGVIGNLASNMDWFFIADAMEKTPNASWVFVGPTSMQMQDPAQDRMRHDLQARDGRIRFTGSKPYAELAQYAQAFDVALLPYRKQEPTYSGSATRFYEHLAACRPMLATRGFHELLSKEPLLTLVDTGDDVSAAIRNLRKTNFRDGLEELRWRASHEGTWHVRARTLLNASLQPGRLMVA